PVVRKSCKGLGLVFFAPSRLEPLLLPGRSMSLRSSLPFLLSGAVALASASGAVAWGYAHYVPSESPCEGLRIDGESLPRDVELRTWVEERASKLESRPITLRVDGLPD